MCGTAKWCCRTSVSHLNAAEMHPGTVLQGAAECSMVLQDRWTASVPAQSRRLPSPCGRPDDDSPHACPCRGGGVSGYSLTHQGVSRPYSLGISGDPSPSWQGRLSGPQLCSDHSHVVRVHSVGHIGTDHVGLGHSLLEGCQVLWRCRDPAQHQLRQQGLRTLCAL